jgi:hypothetical protein
VPPFELAGDPEARGGSAGRRFAVMERLFTAGRIVTVETAGLEAVLSSRRAIRPGEFWSMRVVRSEKCLWYKGFSHAVTDGAGQ